MIRKRKEEDFFSMFNDSTGMYLRSGIIRDGKDTGADPFMASFPELLDIGVMGHCSNSEACMRAGIECYQGGAGDSRPNMALEDFMMIVKQCKGNTYQIALGGHGDPDEHEDFGQLLKICRKYGIVPNFTTSGHTMNQEKAELCREYCGAVAVSWQRGQHTQKALDILIGAGVKTNIHYVVSNATIDEAVARLRDDDFYHGINAVIFLLHKPVGCGTEKNMINIGDSCMEDFMRLAMGREHPYRIGFDSCTVPAIMNMSGDIEVDMDSFDTCEGARWSAYISPDLMIMPCSFDNRDMRWAVSLREYTIKQAWDSTTFCSFRDHMRNACRRCGVRSACMGGCPICPQIVLCNREQRDIQCGHV